MIVYIVWSDDDEDDDDDVGGTLRHGRTWADNADIDVRISHASFDQSERVVVGWRHYSAATLCRLHSRPAARVGRPPRLPVRTISSAWWQLRVPQGVARMERTHRWTDLRGRRCLEATHFQTTFSVSFFNDSFNWRLSKASLFLGN